MKTNVSKQATPRRRLVRRLLIAATVACVSLGVVGIGVVAAVGVGIRQALEKSGYIEVWTDADGFFVDGVPYGPNDWNKIDLYFPKEIAPERSRGAVLFIHGGAWNAGNRQDMAGFARRTAKGGYVAASLGYMLAGDKTKDVYSMNAVMDEIDAALKTLKEEATKRGAPLEKVALSGDSAGGHIATLYAYSRGKNAPLPVVFVAPRVGPSDFHLETWPNLDPETVAGIVSIMTRKLTSVEDLKAKTPETEAAIASISPAAFAENGGAIPTLAAFGGEDNLVPTPHRERLVAALEKSGVKFDVVDFPNSGHMLASDPEATERRRELFFEYADRYLNVVPETENAAE
ncbi:MAG: alpha/beta hydrolase [Thermoguttaceae bacterium]|nr:alpha/beta hydrolase [Thermoguttaceae bacterium]